MIDSIIQFSIKQRWVILLLVLGTAILGVYNYQRLPIDAVPDITNNQVQVLKLMVVTNSKQMIP